MWTHLAAFVVPLRLHVEVTYFACVKAGLGGQSYLTHVYNEQRGGSRNILTFLRQKMRCCSPGGSRLVSSLPPIKHLRTTKPPHLCAVGKRTMFNCIYGARAGSCTPVPLLSEWAYLRSECPPRSGCRGAHLTTLKIPGVFKCSCLSFCPKDSDAIGLLWSRCWIKNSPEVLLPCSH